MEQRARQSLENFHLLDTHVLQVRLYGRLNLQYGLSSNERAQPNLRLLNLHKIFQMEILSQQISQYRQASRFSHQVLLSRHHYFCRIDVRSECLPLNQHLLITFQVGLHHIVREFVICSMLQLILQFRAQVNHFAYPYFQSAQTLHYLI